MRPVNLIPPEQRRGDRAPMRTGPLSYVVVGVLAAALVAVTLLVMTNNKISDREAERASLESQVARAEAEAQRLALFRGVRVPPGCAGGDRLEPCPKPLRLGAGAARAGDRDPRGRLAHRPERHGLARHRPCPVEPQCRAPVGTESITGPSLQIEGCAAGHEAVAKFLAALQDIDGVTRVSVLKSDRPELAGAGAAATADSASSGGCPSRDFVSTFQVAAAFDAVQVGAEAQEPVAGHAGDRDDDIFHDASRSGSGRGRGAAARPAEGLGRPADPEGRQGQRHLHPGSGYRPMRRNELTIASRSGCDRA